jgi:hypothetical protein
MHIFGEMMGRLWLQAGSKTVWELQKMPDSITDEYINQFDFLCKQFGRTTWMAIE